MRRVEGWECSGYHAELYKAVEQVNDGQEVRMVWTSVLCVMKRCCVLGR